MRLTLRHAELLALVLLACTFVLVFALAGGWSDGQIFGDDPAYIDLVRRVWTSGAGRGTPVAFSPLYLDLFAPFVLANADAGFRLWRFLLFGVTTLLVFVNVKRLSNAWVGLVAGLHFELLSEPYLATTLATLSIAWLLACSLLLLARRSLLGVATGLLILGIHVRGEFAVIVAAFLGLTLLWNRHEVIRWSFVAQLAPFLLLFVGLIYWHNSSLAEYPTVFSERGAFAYQDYMTTTMFEMGYFKPYTSETVRGNLTFEDKDRVWSDVFGKSLSQFRADARFDLPELYQDNPAFVREHYRRLWSAAPSMVAAAFAVDIPPGRGILANVPRISVIGEVLVPMFALLVALGPALVLRGRFERCTATPVVPARVYALLLAPFAALVPWFLAAPQPYYIVMLVPSVYLGVGLLARTYGVRSTRSRERPVAVLG